MLNKLEIKKQFDNFKWMSNALNIGQLKKKLENMSQKSDGLTKTLQALDLSANESANASEFFKVRKWL